MYFVNCCKILRILRRYVLHSAENIIFIEYTKGTVHLYVYSVQFTVYSVQCTEMPTKHGTILFQTIYLFSLFLKYVMFNLMSISGLPTRDFLVK